MHESVNEMRGDLYPRSECFWWENDDEVASITRFYQPLRKFQFIRVFGRLARSFKSHANDTTSARTKTRLISLVYSKVQYNMRIRISDRRRQSREKERENCKNRNYCLTILMEFYNVFLHICVVSLGNFFLATIRDIEIFNKYIHVKS